MTPIAPTPTDLARHSLPSLSRLALRLTKVVEIWGTRRRSRKDLAMLDAHTLNDIGLDPISAYVESRKPFWRI